MDQADKLWRLPTGKYLAGVFVEADGYGRYTALVLLARKDERGGIISEQSKKLSGGTFEEVAQAAREWALGFFPGLYGVRAEDFEVRLLRAPEIAGSDKLSGN